MIKLLIKIINTITWHNRRLAIWRVMCLIEHYTSYQHLWYIDSYLDKIKHFKIIDKKQIRGLRKADKIEKDIGDITEYKFRKKKI